MAYEEEFDKLLLDLDIAFGGSQYEEYTDDPVAFCRNVLHTEFTKDIKRLCESVRDYPITIAMSANATGKTHAAARVGVWWYKVFPDSQVYTAAAPPEGNLRKLLWAEIGSILDKSPQVFKHDAKLNLEVRRSAKSFITGVTIPTSGSEYQRESKFSGKHSPYLLFIVDEGDSVPDEVYRGIESCMSGGHARLLVMFNPRHKSGYVYRLIRDKQANVVSLSAMDHPNVVTGDDIIPGAVTRDTVVRRTNVWCDWLGDVEPQGIDQFILPEFLEGAVGRSLSGLNFPPLRPGAYKIIEPGYSYMVLGRYPGQSPAQLISLDWINEARDRYDLYVAKSGHKPPEQAIGVAGLDIADLGNDKNALCTRYGNLVTPLSVWRGVDVLQTSDIASDHLRNLPVSVCNVDATGVGAGVTPAMQRNEINAIAVKVANRATEETELGQFNILRDQLWWSCREWLRQSAAMLPPDDELIEELQTPSYEVKNGRIYVMKKEVMVEKLRRSPDKADALCLTFKKSDSLWFGECDL